MGFSGIFISHRSVIYEIRDRACKESRDADHRILHQKLAKSIDKSSYGTREAPPRRMDSGGVKLLHSHENNDNDNNKNTACTAMRHAGICHRATQLSR